MKKIIGSLMLLGSFTFASAQTISFEKTTIDYGTVPVNANGGRVFTFKNSGDKPLILSNVQPACGCTASEWPKEPIMPGKVGQIKVNYNTATAAPFKKTIDVFSNDPTNGRVVLYIQGNVDASLKAEATEKKNFQEEQHQEKVENKAETKEQKNVEKEQEKISKEQQKAQKVKEKADKAVKKAQKQQEKAVKAAEKAEKAAKKAEKAAKKAQRAVQKAE